MARQQAPIPPLINFATAGLGGVGAWFIVHPFNTVSVRMNLATATGKNQVLGFLPFCRQVLAQEGAVALYKGLGAGVARQAVYVTARIGIYEVIRDKVKEYRKMDFASRLLIGLVSGGMAAVVSCPAEVSLVRMSNDNALPVDQRRNYKGVFNAGMRIAQEEGIYVFWRGCMPFVYRAMLVGACQVGTYDQLKATYIGWGITHPVLNVFCSSMSSGLLYSVVTMPVETAKNRMAFQKPDNKTGILPYRNTGQTISVIAQSEGILSLWRGFTPYYVRSGGLTVAMFLLIEQLRSTYQRMA